MSGSRASRAGGLRSARRRAGARSWFFGVVLTLALVAALAPAAHADLAQTAITDSPGIRDYRPAATDTYFAWHRNSAAHPNHYDVFAREVGANAFKVNPDGTSAGGGGIDGTTLVYSQWKPGRVGNLQLFDLVAWTRTALPSEVNTRGGDEWGPSISGDWIEFARTTQQYYREFIYNVVTDELRMLDEVSRADRRNYIEPGQVSGNYVTWMRCGRVTCKVRLYDITAQTTTVLDVASGRYQFGAAVTADGTLYYGEANATGCGSGVRLMQLPVGGAPTTLVSFNRGIDFIGTYAYEHAGGTDLYYAKLRCSTETTDIYRVTNP